jgi:hypothetical protein
MQVHDDYAVLTAKREGSKVSVTLQSRCRIGKDGKFVVVTVKMDPNTCGALRAALKKHEKEARTFTGGDHGGL